MFWTEVRRRVTVGSPETKTGPFRPSKRVLVVPVLEGTVVRSSRPVKRRGRPQTESSHTIVPPPPIREWLLYKYPEKISFWPMVLGFWCSLRLPLPRPGTQSSTATPTPFDVKAHGSQVQYFPGGQRRKDGRMGDKGHDWSTTDRSTRSFPPLSPYLSSFSPSPSPSFFTSYRLFSSSASVLTPYPSSFSLLIWGIYWFNCQHKTPTSISVFWVFVFIYKIYVYLSRV